MIIGKLNMDMSNIDKDENNIHITTIAENFWADIENAPFYNTFYKNLERVTGLRNINVSSFRESLIEVVKDSGLENELRNGIYYWMRERNYFQTGAGCWIQKEPLDYLREAQMRWEMRIYKTINSMCSKLKLSLSLFRQPSNRDEIMEKWNVLSTYSIDLSQYLPLYAPKDFLEVLLNIRNPNYNVSADNDSRCQDFTFVPLYVISLSNLKIRYEDLIKDLPLLSTCQHFSQSFCSLEEQRILEGEAVLKRRRAQETKNYLKRLAPSSLRARLWAQALGSEVFPWNKEYYKNLKTSVIQFDMLVDKLIIKDIQLTVCNDDQYFVFEDLLYQVMLCFTRDTAIAQISRRSCSNPALGILKGKSNTINNTVIYPPNGVIPFYGISMYVAPLCYVFRDPVQIYFSARSFYLRHWFRLHEINSHPQGILSLCILFQRLLENNEPQLSQHLASIEVQPIRVVFKWLMKCFSGYLPPEQLLYLWDLILAYDSLDIVPLLAVAVLSFRKSSLFQVETLQSVEAVLNDLSTIQIIPLLQFVIMSD